MMEEEEEGEQRIETEEQRRILISEIIIVKWSFSLLSLLSRGTRWNQVEPSDLTFQVSSLATNELPTSNGSREVDSHQSA